MSDGSDIALTVDGTDITTKVMFETASFESQLNAIPGTCEFTVKDPTRALSFVTGKEITLSVDGTNYWAGYVSQIDRTHAFDADDTTSVSSYDNRLWVIHGVDYNILFDKRVLRQTTDYLTQIPNLAGTTQDGAILRSAIATYIDNPAGFDGTTYIDDCRQIHDFDTSKAWAWPAQGTKVRDLFDEISKWEGQIFYIDADKNWHFHSLERAESRWGFSDQPNNAPITTATSQYQGATYGFREVEAVEDGSVIINDALVWGGSAFAGTSGGTVFARVQDATSQTDHGRTQYAEVRFGEPGFGIQAGVDARADVIVNGPPGTDIYGEQKGLRYPQWTFSFTWFGRDVPKISGVRQHIRPGSLVTIVMNVFGVTKLLPLRSVRLRFPGQAPDGKTFVTFTGEFGLQTSDPFTLWRYLLNNQGRIQTTVLSVTDDTSTSTTYGSYGTFVPTPITDGVTTVFDLPFGYISTTLEVYLNGLTQRSGTDFTESDPEGGGFTMTSAPLSTDNLLVRCRTLAA